LYRKLEQYQWLGLRYLSVDQVVLRPISTMFAALAPCAIVLAKLIQCHAELGLVMAFTLQTCSKA
jgi:hypothetical protein